MVKLVGKLKEDYMQIEVTEVEPCKLSIHYTAGSEEISDKRNEVLSHFKKAPVKGYRQGRVPLDAIKIHYHSQIEESLKRALAEDAFHNTLFEKKIKPHGAPRFNSALLMDGKFVCEFELHTKPNFELNSYDDLQIPKPHIDSTAVELAEKMMQELRVRYGEASPYAESDFVQMGDNLILNYEGAIDGEVLPSLCATGEMLTVGNSNIANFDSNLLGMTMDETREFDVLVPDSSVPSLAGKTVRLKATLVMGSKAIPCPLDDTLAHKIGKKDFNELKEFVNGTAAANMQNNLRSQINNAVANKLIDTNSIDVPNWMSLSEAKYLVQNSKMDWNTLKDEDKESFLQMAEKNVKLSLILDRVREDNPEAQLSDQEVFETIKFNLAKTQSKDSVDDAMEKMSKSGYLQILFSRIRDEHAIDFITKKVQLVE